VERLGLEHGQLCYLQIPARDVGESAAFYATVFGWQVEPPDAGFTSPGLIGQWVEEADPAAGGPLLWLQVRSIEAALELAASAGGEVLEAPARDGPYRLLARVRDPAGNIVGIVEHHAESA
jgi:uncharacterized protein